ncbi:MAG: ABC transporter ATP-binding protein [Bacillota bacterium]|nr:ABC transporter ATP-binding protein [Bacillota bacterium]
MTGRGTDSKIRLENVSKRFRDGTVAVDNVSLDIQAGELLAIVGPSGCGKTTTLRIVSGLERADTGRVYFDGVDVTDVPAEKRNVGVVFQSYALFPNMTVVENIEYGLRIRRVPPAQRRERAGQLMEMLKIAGLAHRRPSQLSGGQQQRVALARALVIEPAVLLLDEPLTALDAKLRDELRVELQRVLKRLGITALYVTHDQAEAMCIGDRIAVMNQGRMVQIDVPTNIYRRPATAFVAGFIGTTNMARGHLAAEGGRLYVDVGYARFPVPSTTKGPGEELTVLFRPEDVSLAAPGQEHFRGRIENIFFLGDKVRVFVRTFTGEEVIADLPSESRVERSTDYPFQVDAAKLYSWAEETA